MSYSESEGYYPPVPTDKSNGAPAAYAIVEQDREPDKPNPNTNPHTHMSFPSSSGSGNVTHKGTASAPPSYHETVTYPEAHPVPTYEPFTDTG